MTMRKILCGLLVLMPVFWVAGLAVPGRTASATATYTVQKNLCYEPAKSGCTNGVSHEFDEYLPVGASQKTPGVVLVHGGSFKAGDKAAMSSIAISLAQDGMAAFSINYRLDSPTVVGFPMESQDVMAAVTYLRNHAGMVDVDPARLALFGSSAGATLAVYSGLVAYQNEPSAQVAALVGWSGGYDFTGDLGANGASQLGNIGQYLGCDDPTIPSCEATATSASAVSWVEPGDPPTLLANSTDYQPGCEIVDPAQAEEMATDLENAGVTTQLDLNSECAHAQAYSNIELAPTIAFLEAHLFVAPKITTVSTASFTAGTAGTFIVKAKANPTATITEVGPLPAGISFVDEGNGSALISGTAAAGSEDTYPLVITAANGGVPAAVQRFTLTVH
jgi:acetyl esterase